jgi:hypothetical protein
MEYCVYHKIQGWVAMITWSPERTQAWLAKFNPSYYIDKTLNAEDFEVRPYPVIDVSKAKGE